MEIIHLTNEKFTDLIQEKTLVDFYANWCGPCKMIAPELEKVESKIKVIKVDVDKFEELARTYGVMSIPTLILFENRNEIKRTIGFIDKNNIEKISWLTVSKKGWQHIFNMLIY